MKIFVRDDNDLKISSWHIKHWESLGHEVKHNMYPDFEMVAWCDVAIFFWCDNYAQMLSTEGAQYPCQKIIQVVDIDAWFGHWGGVDWTQIDDVVFMSKHIQDMVMGHLNAKYEDKFPARIHHFPLGIEPKDWKFRDRTKDHKKVMGFVAAEWWSAKNPAMVVQLMKKLVDIDPEWHFKWAGDFGPEKWLHFYLQNQIDDLGLRDHVEIDFHRQDSLDDWWEGVDYFVTCSQKDSFSLIVAEAMAKGIKTLVHNFGGAKNIWDPKYVWSSLDEAVAKITANDYDSQEYRDYIEKNHDIKPILAEWDKVLTLGKRQ